MNRGLYIVIEGLNGLGKTTQVNLLVQRLAAAGLLARPMREPDSQSDLTARAIRNITQDIRYPMNTKTEVLLYNAARSQSLDAIRELNEREITCIVDQSYLSTLAYQYYARGDLPDYEAVERIISFAVGDMEPDLTVVLSAPVNKVKHRLLSRHQGDRFDSPTIDFMERVRKGYELEAKKRGYPIINAEPDIDTISDQIWNRVSDTLKTRPKKRASKRTQSDPKSVAAIIEDRQRPKADLDETDQPLLIKNDDGKLKVTAEGKNYLKSAVTNTEDNVYAFTGKIPSTTIAAAMARLSRRGDDMRITLLDEFAGRGSKDEDLLRRVITAYGDDSVQQLAGIHLVVENASNLLTKKLEWGRLAAYLEQSTRYIYFDQKDDRDQYKYYTPRNLDANSAREYEKTINNIFDLYSKMVRRLTEFVRNSSNVPEKEQDIAWKGATRAQACDAIRPVLPVATKATVGIFASGQALESLIMHLMSDRLDEARLSGEAMLAEARKVAPVFLERADRPDRGGAMIAYRSTTAEAVRKLAEKKLSQNLSPETSDVTLSSYFPKNELDILPHMLYEYSQSPLEEIEQEVDGWSYEDKLKAFKTYFGERLNRRHKPGRALEQAHYTWDLVCDYGIFRDLQRHRMVDDLTWQELTPRYGYDVPALVEEAGLTDDFERCFDMSFNLYSKLQSAGYPLEAQYATLLGHKMRWKVTYNAREAFHLHELRTTPQGHPGYRKLVKKMHDTLASVHPLIAQQMIFVNKDEDPELTRLAAEKYTQFKLKQLGSRKK